ncbi:FxSxx-COOH cyclophane-containing RiPP peptide [Actinoplanes sp. NPDC026670]|uniref:FxSxx-COOH cyclophane-containing RiPP peptide n=1 Tax=Actinoplanes sp. NPDC026670 TaxID=3154700 RepID=UPI0033FF2B18
MNAVPEEGADRASGETLLLDVRTMPAAEIAAARDSALSRSLRRVLDSLDDPNGVLSAFSSFASS